MPPIATTFPRESKPEIALLMRIPRKKPSVLRSHREESLSGPKIQCPVSIICIDSKHNSIS
jgi:hypothetical protein